MSPSTSPDGSGTHTPPPAERVPIEVPTATLLGALARVELTVTDADTAQTVGSGDVPVLATPRVLALVEAASVAATARRLPAGSTSVGVRAELDHLAATPIGRTVVAEAKVIRVDGRKLRFAVQVTDGTAIVAEGVLDRAIVDRHRFLARATAQP